MLPQENIKALTRFLTTHQDAEEITIDAEWGTAQTIGRQILPAAMDGFYYAKLRKR